MRTAEESRSLGIFRFMLHMTARMHGRIRSCFNLMKTGCRRQWRAARRMDFLPTASFGAIRSTDGIIIGIPALTGGYSESKNALPCMTWSGLIISGGSMNIILFHTKLQRQSSDSGSRARALIYSAHFGTGLETVRSLRRIWAI